jgi:hypothetical protein
MRKKLVIALGLLLAGGVTGQLSGPAKLLSGTQVVVADVENGSAIDQGIQARVRATVTVVRNLQGNLNPGSVAALEWTFRPNAREPIAAGSGMPPMRALFFLRAGAGGIYEPLPIAGPGRFGGVFSEVPREASPLVSSLPPDASIQVKLAREMEWAFQKFAADPVRLGPAFDVIAGLDQAGSIEVFRDLSSSSEQALKLLGLMGRIRAGDPGAMLEFEKAQASLAPAFNRWHWTTYLTAINFANDLPSAHAMGRAALAETVLPGLESLFLTRVPTTRSLEFLPYVAVMLNSPDISMREFAAQGFCRLLAPQGLWTEGMSENCPNQIPMQDTRRAESVITYWKDWWGSHSAEVAGSAAVPQVTAPARYGVKPRVVQTSLAPEARFQAAVRMSVVATGRGSPDPLGSKMSAVDREVWDQVTRQVNSGLELNRDHALDVRASMRLQGGLPPPTNIPPRIEDLPAPVVQTAQALDAERQEVLRKGLADAQSRLSPAAWQVLNDFMTNQVAGASVSIQPGAR